MPAPTSGDRARSPVPIELNLQDKVMYGLFVAKRRLPSEILRVGLCHIFPCTFGPGRQGKFGALPLLLFRRVRGARNARMVHTYYDGCVEDNLALLRSAGFPRLIKNWDQRPRRLAPVSNRQSELVCCR